MLEVADAKVAAANESRLRGAEHIVGAGTEAA